MASSRYRAAADRTVAGIASPWPPATNSPKISVASRGPAAAGAMVSLAVTG
jgi:hypothetical protein